MARQVPSLGDQDRQRKKTNKNSDIFQILEFEVCASNSSICVVQMEAVLLSARSRSSKTV